MARLGRRGVVLCGLLAAPWAFMAGTAGVVGILVRREFHSDVLAVLADDAPVF